MKFNFDFDFEMELGFRLTIFLIRTFHNLSAKKRNITKKSLKILKTQI